MAVTYSNLAASWQTPYYEYRGLSTDAKPTDAPENSRFVELDTGARFYFSNGSWHVETTTGGNNSGGSDGGSSAAGSLVVTLTEDDTGEETEYAINKTMSELQTAFQAGANIYLDYDGVQYPLNRYSLDEGESLFFWRIGQEDEQKEVAVFLDEDTGDTICFAEPIEKSSGGGAFVVTMELDAQAQSFVGDKTYAEVFEAKTSGQRVVLSYSGGMAGLYINTDLIGAALSDDGYAFGLWFGDSVTTVSCAATDVNDYFTLSLV